MDNFPLTDPGEDLKSALGMGLNAAKAKVQQTYGKLPQSIRNVTNPALRGTYNAVEPLASKVFNTIGEAPLRLGTGALTNLASGNPISDNLSEILKTPNSSDWHDVLNADKNNGSPILKTVLSVAPGAREIFDLASERAKDIIRNDVGMAMNLTIDPLMHLHLGGMTEVGNKALKAGVEAPTLAKGAASGERSLATLGTLPLVPKAVSKVALGGLTKANEAIGKITFIGGLKEGLQTETGNVGYDNAKLQKLVNPNNEATINSIGQQKADESIINAVSKKTGIPPEQLHQRILDYREPLGARNLPKGKLAKLDWQDRMDSIREEVGKTLPPELKDMADKKIEANKSYNLSEGGKTQKYYVEHNATPEWKQFRNKLYPKMAIPQQQAMENAMHDAVKGVGPLGKYTINEINNKALAGQLHTVPGLGEIPQLSEFKGKLFDDNVARIEGQRYLENAKVLNNKDFIDHVNRIYGVEKEPLLARYRTGELKPGSYVEDPSTGISYPPEIAKSIEKMKNMGSDSPWAKDMAKSWSDFNDFTKKSYFGIFPASLSKIYLGNQALAYVNGLWNPISQAKGLKLAIAIRTGKMTEEEQALFKTLKENRAYGMGLFRNEVPKVEKETYLGSQKAQKFVDMMWEGHNLAEDATRMGTAIEALRQGYSPFAAGKATRKALYDYSDLGELDKKAKSLVPFYTFQRKNLESMAKNWIQNPGRTGLPLKLQNEGNQDFQNQRKNWSMTKSEGTPLPVGDNNLMLHLNSLWPANDINRWTDHPIDTILSMINPFARVPFDVGTNKNLISGQPFV